MLWVSGCVREYQYLRIHVNISIYEYTYLICVSTTVVFHFPQIVTNSIRYVSLYFHPNMSAAVLTTAMEAYKTHRTVIPFCSPEVRDGREGGGGGGEGGGGGGWREKERERDLCCG
jgi:uncharacterized membrane protein